MRVNRFAFFMALYLVDHSVFPPNFGHGRGLVAQGLRSYSVRDATSAVAYNDCSSSDIRT